VSNIVYVFFLKYILVALNFELKKKPSLLVLYFFTILDIAAALNFHYCEKSLP
jgi:hypothetical protein